MNLTVRQYKDFEFDWLYFCSFMKMLYSYDGIKDQDLQRKLFYIQKASAIDSVSPEKVKIRIIKVSLNNPTYHVKDDTGMPESLLCRRTKMMIRERYRVRDKNFTYHYVGDFAHDVIIHSTDNYLSNNALNRLSDYQRFDLTKVFDQMNKYQYALMGNGKDKLPEEFPKKFFFNDDIDILVKSEEIDEIADSIVRNVETCFNDKLITTEIRKSIYGKRVYVYLQKMLLIMFDLIHAHPMLEDRNIQALSEQGILKHGYKHLSLKDELVLRLAKYMENKVWHKNFIRNNALEIDFNLGKTVFKQAEKAEITFKAIMQK